MLPQEIIRRKRDGHELTGEEIAFVVRGIQDGGLSEGQVAAFAMAVFFRGMTTAERVALTLGLTRSGVTLDWTELALPGPVVDKHSSGGVGDKVSLMLAPIVAACGGFVPMISGRGLGHTGGTLDKLSAISGYETQPDIATFRQVVREVGCAVIGQTADLAPADGRLYATRDVTATVESIPLIVSSILSKKVAEGLDGLAMDVKCGSGAFCDTEAMAQDLAQSLVAVARQAGLPTVALITDMDRVLGRNVGNALEVAEAVAYLTGEGTRDPRLHEVTLALAGEMLALGDAGIKVSLDDFGTGYSSLAYLQKFDIDYIKIDQSFVRHLIPDSTDLALCKAIIVMAHALGMKVIAEGVETAQQRALLTEAGCDYGQGYLFARPIDAAEFETLVQLL